MPSSLKFSPVELIAKKRDGNELTSEEIDFFVISFNNGEIPDYQMSAMLMAIYFRGMSDKETADLTNAFCKSGKIADLSSIPGPKVDKHSTGGVGDKISLILAPLASSCGLVVPMMTGRGLGHTGGTLDKLESIPGFKSNLTTDEFILQLSKIGVAMISPTADVAPVDKKVYALRDVTSTVGSLPLVVSSIMSKKICEGPSYILLDVKIGRGSFISEWDKSIKLTKSMIAAGENNGLPTIALMTDMNQPLGKAVGNWLEMREAILTLNGKGPSDVTELVIAQCAHMLMLGGKVTSFKEGMQLAHSNLHNGKGLSKLKEMIISQGGESKYIENVDLYPKSKYTIDIKAKFKGYISEIDPLEIGWSSVMLGAGRQKMEDDVDYSAGILFRKKKGEMVEIGEIIAVAFTEKDDHLSAVDRIHKAITISKDPVQLNPIISHIMTKNSFKKWDLYLKEQSTKTGKRKVGETTLDVSVTANKCLKEHSENA